MSKEKKDDSSTNNRWWESYLVRYLSGSIIGALCILILATTLIDSSNFELHKIIESFKKIDWKYFPFLGIISLLTVGGLIYSYMISSPITVFHYGRGRSSFPESHVRHVWLGWALSIIEFSFLKNHLYIPILINIFLLITIDCCMQKTEKLKGRKKLRHKERIKTLEYILIASISMLIASYTINQIWSKNLHLTFLFLLGIPAIVVGLMQYVTLFRILNEEALIHKFYRKLSRARSSEGAKDIRETYSHLREHSNSTFIVILEVCVTCFLMFIIGISDYKPNDIFGKESKELSANIIIFFSFWLLPNLFMWSRANRIEKDFTRRPRKYLRSKHDQSDWSEW